MRSFLILAFSLYSNILLARSATEEALILNQELEFLEESVKEIEMGSRITSGPIQENKTPNSPNLEKMYFNDSEDENSITTRSSAPKRRGF